MTPVKSILMLRPASNISILNICSPLQLGAGTVHSHNTYSKKSKNGSGMEP